METPVNPCLPCNDYPRAAGDGANGIYRQAAQELSSLLAGICGITLPSNGKLLAQISTLCKADPKTKLAKSILLSAKTIPLDDTQLQCFGQAMQLGSLAGGVFGCYVNNLMISASPDVQVWEAVIPPETQCEI